jgi:hypothetical protein
MGRCIGSPGEASTTLRGKDATCSALSTGRQEWQSELQAVADAESVEPFVAVGEVGVRNMIEHD